MPTRSMVTGLPRSTEKPSKTQGRYGAVNGKSPKKDMRWCGFNLFIMVQGAKQKQAHSSCTARKRTKVSG